MKKIIGVSFALVLSAVSFSQDNEQIQNKNGVDIMPVSGEWGVGMNALPIFSYIGNALNGTAGNTLGGNKFVNYWAGNTLFGKYMLSDNTAIRAQLRIGQYSNTYHNYVYDDNSTNPDDLLLESYRTQSSFYNIGAGYEFRRGKNRLRGIYGGEVMYRFQRGMSSEYQYANTFGTSNLSPTSTTWFSWGGVMGENAEAERVLSQTGGNYNGAGLRGFIGVEYYIAPKICFGTEFGWGLMYGATGEMTTVTEYWDAGNAIINTRNIKTASNRGLSIDTDNFGGSLYMMFYF